MKYLINLGDYNHSNFEEIKKSFNFEILNFQKYLGAISVTNKQSKLVSDNFSEMLKEYNEGFGNVFFVNHNSSHEVSALTSALCFKKNGKQYNEKIILNFDYHSDYSSLEKSEIKYCNWGVCIHKQSYKKYIDKKDCKYSYYSTDFGNGKRKCRDIKELNSIINEICKKQNEIDLYITIDTDVYIKNLTSYGDGVFAFEAILEQLNQLKNTKSCKINFCGADITGYPDIVSGYYNEDTKKIYLSELDGTTKSNLIKNSVEKINCLLAFFDSWK